MIVVVAMVVVVVVVRVVVVIYTIPINYRRLFNISFHRIH